jgi:type IV secretory pathway TrbL component
VAITGATATTYKLATADVGHEITVQVTATDADHRTGQATAKPTAKVT